MFELTLPIAVAAFDRPATPSDWLRVVDRLHPEPGFWWLDTALRDDRLGRTSFAGANPYLWLHARGDEVEIDVRRAVRPGLAVGRHQNRADPIEFARSLLPRTDAIAYSRRSGAESGPCDWQATEGLSADFALPFLGGAVGFFGYELASVIEPQLNFANADVLGLPDLSLAFVDQLLAYDHETERLWVIGLGFGDADTDVDAGGKPDGQALATERSRERVDALSAETGRLLAERSELDRASAIRVEAPSESVSFTSTADASGYAKAVDTILQEIAKGNVYQANFSQCLSVDAPVDPWELYDALRRHNPAPFGGFLSAPGATVLSSSPERFLKLDTSRMVESRPIKGTRARGGDEAEDLRLSVELAASPKDRAENLMIVDLVRNDLGRVCEPGSIRVEELMSVEAYAAVFQMVSTVVGKLDAGLDGFDLLRAMFPPGSMTGAPKLAAIELLEELEAIRRGVYAGALGYLDLRGGLDLSVVIRTIVCRDGQAHLHVGGGVVADSSPEGEYLESLDKAKAPLAALAEVVGRASR
jgi:para-aminobenzoate synthetase component 1